ncbi:MAG TPA: TolC family protein [Burkholderiales bacterium]|nr:TolC family protein [Burkholderiales bacterium]
MLVALAGCALRAPPSGEVIRGQMQAQTGVSDSWTGGDVASDAVIDGWVAEFADPVLDAYIEEALTNNADLQSAAMRVEQARHYVTAAGGALYPAVNAMARGGGNDADPSAGWAGAVISAAWELDVWGRVRAGRAAAVQSHFAAAADYAFAKQSLAALTAKSWFLAIEAQLQLAIAEDSVRTAELVVELARSRLAFGAGAEYDIVIAQASLGTLLDTQQQLKLAHQQSLRALEILLGRYPAARLASAVELPKMPPPVPAGLPSQLLERRPDVVAAERRITAAFYMAEEARTARLPQISLTGSASDISSDLFVLKDRNNPVWSAGARLLAPLFRGGALKAQHEIRTAEQAQAIAEYTNIGLRAFNEVEVALANEFALKARESILQSVVDRNRRALELAQARYRLGASDLRDVSQQQLALFSASTTLLRVQTEARVQRVNLYLALGGNFASTASARNETAP